MRRTVAIGLGALILLGIGAYGAFRLGALRNTSLAAVTIKPATCADAYRVLKLRPSQITRGGRSLLDPDPAGIRRTQWLRRPGIHRGWGQRRSCWDVQRAQAVERLPSSLVGDRGGQEGVSAADLNSRELAASGVDLDELARPRRAGLDRRSQCRLESGHWTGDPERRRNHGNDRRQPVARRQPATRGIHITGQWACGVPPATTYDATVPCAGFYALNHLQDADVARMKAQACNPQDLTFSGDISAHLDHAITDTAILAFWRSRRRQPVRRRRQPTLRTSSSQLAMRASCSTCIRRRHPTVPRCARGRTGRQRSVRSERRSLAGPR